MGMHHHTESAGVRPAPAPPMLGAALHLGCSDPSDVLILCVHVQRCMWLQLPFKSGQILCRNAQATK